MHIFPVFFGACHSRTTWSNFGHCPVTWWPHA